jgi:hypothetical protein
MGMMPDKSDTGIIIPTEKINFSRNEKEIELSGLVTFDL